MHTDPVSVTQEDRVAAADLTRITSNVLWANELADAIEAGKRDGTEIVQAFARHRPTPDTRPAASGSVREAVARKLCEQHGGDPDAVATDEHDCWEGPLRTAFAKDADEIIALAAAPTPDTRPAAAGSVREADPQTLIASMIRDHFHGTFMRETWSENGHAQFGDHDACTEVDALASDIVAALANSSAAAPTPDAAASGLPDRFEAWWATYKHRNRDQASYAMKKQIAFDAFEVASLTDATAKVASTSTPADRS